MENGKWKIENGDRRKKGEDRKLKTFTTPPVRNAYSFKYKKKEIRLNLVGERGLKIHCLRGSDCKSEPAGDNGNSNSRGSAGCQTIAPSDAESFFSNFDWSGRSGNTGITVGTITVVRNNERSASMTASFETRKTMQQQNLTSPLQPLTPRAIVSVSQ